MHTLTPAKLAMAAAATLLAAGVALAPITYALDVVDWQGTDISNAQAQMLVWAGVDYNHPGSNDWRSVAEQSGNDYSSGILKNFSRLTITVQQLYRSSCSLPWTHAGTWSNTFYTASWNQKISPSRVNPPGSCLKRWAIAGGEFWLWQGTYYSGQANKQT